MSKNPTLRQRAASHPNEEFAVVVVTDCDSLPVPLTTALEEIVGMDNMWHGKVRGVDVLGLLDDPRVLSVDEDTEQTIL